MLFNTISLIRTNALLAKSVQLESSTVTFNDNTLTVSGDGSVTRDQVAQYADNTFTLVIGGTVDTIAANTFEGFSALTNVTISSSLTISDNAFHNCAVLRAVDFQNSAITFGVSAFEGCRQLFSITVKGTVNAIPANAFKDCTSLDTVILETTPRDFKIGDNAFYGCQNLYTFHTLTDTVSVGKNSRHFHRRISCL